MLKRIILLLISGIMTLYLGYNKEPNDGIVERYFVESCVVMVDDKEIDTDGYAKINYFYRNSEIPLICTLKELGANLEYKTDDIIMIEYDGISTQIDISKSDFGILVQPGDRGIVRKKINDELIVDSTSLDILVTAMFKVDINIDYINATVCINHAG